MSSDHWYDAVSEHSEPIRSGQPISASTNLGLRQGRLGAGVLGEPGPPACAVALTRWKRCASRVVEAIFPLFRVTLSPSSRVGVAQRFTACSFSGLAFLVIVSSEALPSR